MIARFPFLVLAAILIATLTLAGCSTSTVEDGAASATPISIVEEYDRAGIEWLIPPEEIPGVEQLLVGKGADAVILLREREAPPSRDGVVYLHGWSILPPSALAADLLPYLRLGGTVVFPVYRVPDTPTGQVRRHALAGIRAGLSHARIKPETLVAVGHNTGGALAFDYAALAPGLGLPQPRAVIAFQPARRPGGFIPPADLHRIPPHTRLIAAIAPDPLVPHEQRVAPALLRQATGVPDSRRSLVSLGSARSMDRSEPTFITRSRRLALEVIEKVRGSG